MRPITNRQRFGVVDHVATAHDLLIDIDQNDLAKLRNVAAVVRFVGMRPVWLCYQRTKRGWHVIVHLRGKHSPEIIVALQAVCGSDLRRESLNLMRLLAIKRGGIDQHWQQRWQLLYREKLRP